MLTGAAPSTPDAAAPDAADEPEALRERCGEEADLRAVYAGLAALGIDYGPVFRGLEKGYRTDSEAVGRLAGRSADGHLVHPAVFDAAFHTAALPAHAPEGRAFVPAGLGRLRFTGLRGTPRGPPADCAPWRATPRDWTCGSGTNESN